MQLNPRGLVIKLWELKIVIRSFYIFLKEFIFREFIITNNDDEDIAIAANKGTTNPIIAKGTAIIL